MIPRRFADDPLRPSIAMTDDHRGHPVVEIIRRRRAEGSRPGERHDGRRVALAIEGGGMRGVVSAGMTAALEQLGLRDSFDELHGASAGAFNAAFLLADQAAYLTTLYQYGFGDPRFVSALRALRGGPLFDMDYVIGEVWSSRRPLRFDAILSSPIDLHCTATDADRVEIVDLTELRDDEEIKCALRASARLPWLAGPPAHFRGRRLLDATLFHYAVRQGAQPQTGTTVADLHDLSAGLIVGAWGRWGRFDTQLGRAFVRDHRHRNFGFKRHYRGPQPGAIGCSGCSASIRRPTTPSSPTCRTWSRRPR